MTGMNNFGTLTWSGPEELAERQSCVCWRALRHEERKTMAGMSSVFGLTSRPGQNVADSLMMMSVLMLSHSASSLEGEEGRDTVFCRIRAMSNAVHRVVIRN